MAVGQLIDLGVSNTAASKAALFKTPTTFTGAVWGSSGLSLDSLTKISAANWSLLSGSYLIGKGTISNGASTTDISGTVRNSVPCVGAYEVSNPTVLTSEESIENSTKLYRLGNQIYNLVPGDLITIYDTAGRKQESIVATGITASFKSNGFVIVIVQQKSGNRVCLK